MSDAALQIELADLARPEHRHAVVALLEHYANDAMGIGRLLPDGRARQAVIGLSAMATSRVFLSSIEGRYVGMAVCFVTYSTFAGCRALNVHDLVVHGDWRRKGIARKLLEFAADYAKQYEAAGKMTLEVRTDNAAAKALYQRLGFGPGEVTYEFWTRLL